MIHDVEHCFFYGLMELEKDTKSEKHIVNKNERLSIWFYYGPHCVGLTLLKNKILY